MDGEGRGRGRGRGRGKPRGHRRGRGRGRGRGKPQPQHTTAPTASHTAGEGGAAVRGGRGGRRKHRGGRGGRGGARAGPPTQTSSVSVSSTGGVRVSVPAVKVSVPANSSGRFNPDAPVFTPPAGSGTGSGAGSGSGAGAGAGGGDGMSVSSETTTGTTATELSIPGVDASHSDIITNGLVKETYECGICLEPILRADETWSCNGRCFRVMHLACIKTWRTKSGATRSEAPWRCPGCQMVYTYVPAYRCFCGRVKRPDFNAYNTPHSCGGTCNRRRLGLCPHKCDQACHPGQCAPCSASGPLLYCGCRRTTYRLRCGQKDPRNTCDSVCGRPLKCRHPQHRCTKPCHHGPCPRCDELEAQSCYCGRSTSQRRCGSGREGPRSRNIKAGEGKGCAVKVPAFDAASGTLAALSLQPSLFVDNNDLERLNDEAHELVVAGTNDEEVAAAGADDPTDPWAPALMALFLDFAAEPVAPPTDGGGGGGGGTPPTVAPPVSLTEIVALRSELIHIPPDDMSAMAVAAFQDATETAVEEARAAQPAPPTLTPSQSNVSVSSDTAAAAAAAAATSTTTTTIPPFSIAALGTKAPTVVPSLPNPAVPRSAPNGRYCCGDVCGAWLDCGLHRCLEICHPGDCRGCQLKRATTCPCGKVGLKDLTPSSAPRRSCLDPIPTCINTCDAPLPCGHLCLSPCHNGPCPPCSTPVTRMCRCQSLSQSGPCEQVLPTAPVVKLARAQSASSRSTAMSGATRASWVSAEAEKAQRRKHGKSLDPPAALTCSKACGATLSCRRHKCQRLCCPLAGTVSAEVAALQDLTSRLSTTGGMAASAGAGAGSGGGGGGGAFVPTRAPVLVEMVDGQDTGHLCVRMCGKVLSCGVHTCDNLCHLGACPPCSVASQDPLTCACGLTRLLPPIVCGTPPPKCTRPCRLPRACGHPHAAFHTCHFDACPPCVALTSKRCLGGHELRANIPCYITEVVCGNRCGRRMPCGVHTCMRSCHAGPCCSDGVMKRLHDAQRVETALAAREARAAFAASESTRTEAEVVDAATTRALNQVRVSCEQPCGALRRSCSHKCASPCHPGESCPSVPCQEPAAIHCKCKRLVAYATCMQGIAEPGTPVAKALAARVLPCTDACFSAQRAAAFGEALMGDSDKPTEVCPFPDELLVHAQENPQLTLKAEAKIRAMLQDTSVHAIDFPPMKGGHRGFIHKLAEAYGLTSLSYDREPKRYARVFKRPPTAAPPPDASPYGDFSSAAESGSGSGSGSGAGAGGGDAVSAPGFDLASLVPMPSCTLSEAVKRWAHRLPGGAKSNPFGTSTRVADAAAKFHPMEPSVGDMPPGDVGSQIHLHGLRGSDRVLRGSLEDAIGTNEYRVRRLDDKNVIVSFQTSGRAARAMTLLQSAEIRGMSVPFKFRWWGVGATERMAPKPRAPAAAAAVAASSGRTGTASAWNTVVRTGTTRPNRPPAAAPGANPISTSRSQFAVLDDDDDDSAW